MELVGSKDTCFVDSASSNVLYNLLGGITVYCFLLLFIFLRKLSRCKCFFFSVMRVDGEDLAEFVNPSTGRVSSDIQFFLHLFCSLLLW